MVKQAKRRVFGVLGREESVYWRAAQGDDCAPGGWGAYRGTILTDPGILTDD